MEREKKNNRAWTKVEEGWRWRISFDYRCLVDVLWSTSKTGPFSITCTNKSTSLWTLLRLFFGFFLISISFSPPSFLHSIHEPGGRMTVMSRCFMCYLYLFRSVFGRYLHWFPWWTEAVHSFRVSLLKIVSNKSPKLDIVECRPFKLFVTTLISIELLFRKRFASFFSELKTGKKCVHLIKCRKCRKVRA